MRMTAKVKHYWKRISDYVRYDFKEIAFPSPLPDPPSTKPKRRKLTLKDHLYVWKTACRLYVKSWKTNDLNLDGDEKETKKPENEKEALEASMMEDLAVAARAGSEHIKPALQRIYMTKATTYRDAMKNFVLGYQEGIAEVMDENKSASSAWQSGDATNDSRKESSSRDEK